MSAVFRFLALAIIIVALALAIAAVPGSVTGTVGAWRFSTSVPMALGLLIAFGALLLVLARLVATFLRLPGRFGVARELRRRRRGEAALTASLLALASADGATARREAARARRLLGPTPHTMLAAADADRASGMLDGAESGYQALADRPDTAFLGLRGLIGIALERGDTARAQSLFRSADEAQPGTRWIREERFRLACRAGDWPAAHALAPDGPARAPLAAAAALALEEREPVRAAKLARDAYRASPGLVPAALLTARAARGAGREGRAVAALRAAWARTPHPELAEAALAPIAHRLQRAQAAERFVAGAPNPVENALLLGRVALDAAIWGEARRHAAVALSGPAGGDRRAHLLLADIADRDPALSEPERRAAHAESLRAAHAAPPPPGWRCEICDAEQTRWHPVCPHCQRIGTVAWRAAIPAAGGRAGDVRPVVSAAPLLIAMASPGTGAAGGVAPGAAGRP